MKSTEGKGFSEMELSEVTKKVINDSKYVTLEKIHNIKNKNKVTFLQFRSRVSRREGNQLQVTLLSFPSFKYLTLCEKYEIEYQT